MSDFPGIEAVVGLGPRQVMLARLEALQEAIRSENSSYHVCANSLATIIRDMVAGDYFIDQPGDGWVETHKVPWQQNPYTIRAVGEKCHYTTDAGERYATLKLARESIARRVLSALLSERLSTSVNSETLVKVARLLVENSTVVEAWLTILKPHAAR